MITRATATHGAFPNARCCVQHFVCFTSFHPLFSPCALLPIPPMRRWDLKGHLQHAHGHRAGEFGSPDSAAHSPTTEQEHSPGVPGLSQEPCKHVGTLTPLLPPDPVSPPVFPHPFPSTARTHKESQALQFLISGTPVAKRGGFSLQYPMPWSSLGSRLPCPPTHPLVAFLTSDPKAHPTQPCYT